MISAAVDTRVVDTKPLIESSFVINAVNTCGHETATAFECATDANSAYLVKLRAVVKSLDSKSHGAFLLTVNAVDCEGTVSVATMYSNHDTSADILGARVEIVGGRKKFSVVCRGCYNKIELAWGGAIKVTSQAQ